MKTIIKLAAVCAIFLIGAGCQEKNTAGGGISTFAVGEAVKQSKQAVYGTLGSGDNRKLAFVILTDSPGAGVVSHVISQGRALAGPSWSGQLAAPGVEYKAEADGLAIDANRHDFARGKVFLVSGKKGNISVKQLDIPIGEGSYKEELERLKKSEELQDFLGKKKDAGAEAKTEAPAAKVAKQDTVDSLTDELIVQLNHFGEAIVSAKDKASAEEAVKKLNGIGDEIAAIAARLNKLETLSEQEIERIEEKMLSADKARNHMEGAMQAVMFDEKVSGIIAPAVGEFAARMKEHQAIFDRHTVSAKRLEQRDKAYRAAAINNLKQMYLLLFEYDQKEGAYPDRLELLQEKGYTVALASIDSYWVDGKKVKFVYRQGFSSKSSAETVLMYTPGLIGGQGVCLLNDGSVKTMPWEEFKPLIESLK